MKLELNQAELNELIYALGILQLKGSMVNKEVASALDDKLRDALDEENKRIDAWQEYVKMKCEEDAIRHELNFKRAYAKNGDY